MSISEVLVTYYGIELVDNRSGRNNLVQIYEGVRKVGSFLGSFTGSLTPGEAFSKVYDHLKFTIKNANEPGTYGGFTDETSITFYGAAPARLVAHELGHAFSNVKWK
jgi:hypothetical protein